MPQFLIETPAQIGDEVSIPPSEAHHVRNVFRYKEGDRISLSDQRGSQYEAVIQSIGKETVQAKILSKKSTLTHQKLLEMAPSLLKKDKMEFVIQKAVELGVSRLCPFWSAHTVVQWKKESKLDRWQKIANEAMKQCGRPTPMILDAPVPLTQILQYPFDGLKVIFWEKSSTSLASAFTPLPSSVRAIIGPEGGFSKEEIALAQQHGFSPLSLGRLTLRAETAFVTAASLLQYELGNI